MDELAKALAAAVTAGTSMAWPAMVLYFIAKIVHSLAGVAAVVGIAVLVTRTFLKYQAAEYAEAARRDARGSRSPFNE